MTVEEEVWVFKNEGGGVEWKSKSEHNTLGRKGRIPGYAENPLKVSEHDVKSKVSRYDCVFPPVIVDFMATAVK